MSGNWDVIRATSLRKVWMKSSALDCMKETALR